jgi:ATP-binding cassette subfamily F protein 3
VVSPYREEHPRLSLFQVIGLHRSYGAHDVLAGVSFVVNRGECAGLIGPNGAGKSTLLRCATGLEVPDRGSVSVEPGATIGFLPQEMDAAPGATVAGYTTGGLPALERAMNAAADALGTHAGDEAYERAYAAFETAGGYARLARAEEVLARLGLDGVPAETLVEHLSGGQKTRLMLARTLASDPSVLLLDEPTNHLDGDALAWLAGFIRSFQGAVIVVSHDRAFLDQVAQAILYLDPVSKQVRRYPGNYSAFATARAAEREQQAERWKTQQEYIARVKSDIARLKGEALDIELNSTPRQPGVRVYARRKAAVAKAREKKLDRFMESEERVERPRAAWGLKLDFGEAADTGREAWRLRDVAAAYPGGPAIFGAVSLDIRHGDRIAITGPNGAGKTTLMRVLAGEMTPAAGEAWRSSSVRVAVIRQEQEQFDPAKSVIETVRPARTWDETALRSFLHFFLFGGDAVHQLVGQCSPGERARLQLALAVAEGANALLLDEPMNHLDIEGREHFEEALEAFPGTVVAVSHDRYFVERFAEREVVVRDGQVVEV